MFNNIVYNHGQSGLGPAKETSKISETVGVAEPSECHTEGIDPKYFYPVRELNYFWYP